MSLRPPLTPVDGFLTYENLNIDLDELGINVKSSPYNAIGDGVANDKDAIVAANAAATLIGAQVYFPAGTYLADNLSPTTSWTGDPGATIKFPAGSLSDCISVGGSTSDITIKGLRIDGSLASGASTGTAIKLNGTRNTVRNCYVHNTPYYGILVFSGATHFAVLDCTVDTTGHYGITLTGSVGTPAQNGIVAGNRVKNTGNGGLGIVGVARNIEFIGNVTENTTGDGLAAYNHDNSHISVVGNVFRNAVNNGIHLGGDHLLVSSNDVDSPTQYGIGIFNDDASADTDVVITGNIVQSAGNQRGIFVNNYSNIMISSNVVKTSSTHGIDISVGNGFTISDNVSIGALGGNGIRIQDATRGAITGNSSCDNSQRGIFSTGACSNVIICGNIVNNNTIGGISATGLTVIGNVGQTLQTYTVTNGATDRAYDASATSVAELANVLGTLIGDLRAQGLVL